MNAARTHTDGEHHQGDTTVILHRDIVDNVARAFGMDADDIMAPLDARPSMPRQLCPVPAAGLEFDGVKVWTADDGERVSLLVYDEEMHGEMVRRWNLFPDLTLALRSIADLAGAYSPTHLGTCGEIARDGLQKAGEQVDGDRLPTYEQLRAALVDLLGPQPTPQQITTARDLVTQAKG